MNILVSACLIGVNCKYNGNSNSNKKIQELTKVHNLIPVCPEQMGGLKTPRSSAEIKQGRVITNINEDVTKEFELGAYEALKVAKLYNCKYAILKQRSPSCGHKVIYDGTFSKTLVAGNGKTAELLEQNGIIILGEDEIDRLNLLEDNNK